MDQSTADAIEDIVKKIVNNIEPKVRYLSKYGGEVFAPNPENDQTIVGGLFRYKHHMSLEFSEGAGFDDPHGHLEGSGKQRRHLKFQTPQDVGNKEAEAFIKQAFDRK